jgi:hypothetical protein
MSLPGHCVPHPLHFMCFIAGLKIVDFTKQIIARIAPNNMPFREVDMTLL